MDTIDDYDDDFVEEKLVKRTLMASAFPALVKSYIKDTDTLFEGFLPGFKDVRAVDFESEEDCVEYLQDLLDDEVENLVVTGHQLPDVASDEELLKKYSEYKIVYLDINVYVREGSCDGDCCGCHDCDDDCACDDEDCDCDDECDCDEDCDCGCHGEGHCECGDDCTCGCHEEK